MTHSKQFTHTVVTCQSSMGHRSGKGKSAGQSPTS